MALGKTKKKKKKKVVLPSATDPKMWTNLVFFLSFLKKNKNKNIDFQIQQMTLFSTLLIMNEAYKLLVLVFFGPYGEVEYNKIPTL